MTDVEAFVAALPKVELHVHLLGAASPETVLALARRHPDRGVPTELDELRAYYGFTDFAHFIQVYIQVNTLVTTAADVTDLVVGLARDLARSAVRYAEVTVTPISHLQQGIGPDELAEALTAGRRRARAETGVELAWVFDVPGEQGAGAGLPTAEFAVRHRPEGTVGFGLGGPEVGVPRELFRDAFDVAREAGLHSVPHAGETTGPATVWAALRELRAERIGHGIRSVEDPRLLAHLAEHGVPLEVCPTSNLRTRAVASLAEHPVPRLLAAGVPVTLASDDPGMFGTDLHTEYLLCAREFGMGRADLADLARAGVRAAFLPDARRAELLAEIDQVALGASRV